jgi:hypothetical protein
MKRLAGFQRQFCFGLCATAKVQQRATSIRRNEIPLVVCALMLTVALGGCITCPEGASWNKWTTSLPTSIPFMGHDESAVECGSACVADEEDNSNCEEIVAEENDDSVADPSTYERLVNRFVVEPTSTVVMTTFSFAGSAFGTVANYCVPEGAIGPPDSMPPGRFHPVPTRPVFSRRSN